MTDFDTLAAGLRAWAAGDWICTAAVELLITHGEWLRRDDFPFMCTESWDDMSRIDWDAARSFVAGGPACTGTELGILRLAVGIGSDEYRLASISRDNAEAVVRAFAMALRAEGMLRG